MTGLRVQPVVLLPAAVGLSNHSGAAAAAGSPASRRLRRVATRARHSSSTTSCASPWAATLFLFWTDVLPPQPFPLASRPCPNAGTRSSTPPPPSSSLPRRGERFPGSGPHADTEDGGSPKAAILVKPGDFEIRRIISPPVPPPEKKEILTWKSVCSADHVSSAEAVSELGKIQQPALNNQEQEFLAAPVIDSEIEKPIKI
uniref:Uncharacterized protein n=1 Tax=Sphaerodactylus townsendi TaxID=933632 RepID=A0ACB8FRK6_9SAUR